MSGAFGWKYAWQSNDPMEGGVLDERGDFDYYDLPDNDSMIRTIFPDDRFWHDDDRVMVEISAVKTKLYQGVVGREGDEGGDYIFYDPDWTKPELPAQTRAAANAPSNWRDEIQYWSVEDFVELLEDGTLRPHKSNGPPRLPY